MKADVYLLDGCSTCNTMKDALSKWEQEYQIKSVKDANELDFNVDFFPVLRLHKNNQEYIQLEGIQAINYVKTGYADQKKLCPLNKLKDCVGEKCQFWIEYIQEEIPHGDCAIPLHVKVVLNPGN